MQDHFRLFCNSTFESVMRREKLLWKKKLTKFMKASSFTKSPYTFVPFQARIWHACTAICVMYILSSENITAVYTMSRRRWDQNTTQVANRLDWARAIYVWLLHLTPWPHVARPHSLAGEGAGGPKSYDSTESLGFCILYTVYEPRLIIGTTRTGSALSSVLFVVTFFFSITLPTFWGVHSAKTREDNRIKKCSLDVFSTEFLLTQIRPLYG